MEIQQTRFLNWTGKISVNIKVSNSKIKCDKERECEQYKHLRELRYVFSWMQNYDSNLSNDNTANEISQLNSDRLISLET